MLTKTPKRPGLVWRATLTTMLGACATKEPILLDLRLDLLPAASTRWTTPDGVEVSVTAAHVGLSQIQLSVPMQANATSVLGGAQATAHPGHDLGGSVRGELLGPWELDLVNGAEGIAQGQAWEDNYERAALSFSSEPASNLQGTAMVDGREVPFDLLLANTTTIDGFPFPVQLKAGGSDTIQIQADLTSILGSIDWNTPDANGDGTLTTVDPPMTETTTFGLTSINSWNLSLMVHPK
jgi:hypothetical protein